MSDFSQKLFVKTAGDVPISVFNFYTYIFSALVLTIFYLVFRKIEKGVESNGTEIVVKTFGYIVVMAICLFVNSFFKTKAAVYLDSVQLYPLNQGAALILSSIMSATLFKEKLTAKCIIGLLLSFIGLLVINVL